jgi:predicted tellurium resistance membrane protein TerC
VLSVGGLFLLAKATLEIHGNVEGHQEEEMQAKAKSVFWMVILQIGILDIVFSLDSVITAVGMARDLPVMVIAVMISVFVMMLFSGHISDFINKHPSLKVLALSFLMMIGVALIGEGLGMHIPKGYIYFAMAFSFVVEMLNLRLRKNMAARNPGH